MLPGSRLLLHRCFARQVEAEAGAPGIGLTIPISSAFHAVINGQGVDASGVALFRGRVPTRVLDPHPNTFALIRFQSAMHNRGWPDLESGFGVFRAEQQRMRHVQSTISSLMQFASNSLDPRAFAALGDTVQETLLAALDSVLVQEEMVRARPRSFEQHRKVVARLEDLVRALPSQPLYSDDLAGGVGVSVRTLQTAVNTVHGMSLHQYLRLKRLWLVRCQLTSGFSGLSVKTVAQSNGFWHMGEFSQLYKDAFGETARETIAHANGK